MPGCQRLPGCQRCQVASLLPVVASCCQYRSPGTGNHTLPVVASGCQVARLPGCQSVASRLPAVASQLPAVARLPARAQLVGADTFFANFFSKFAVLKKNVKFIRNSPPEKKSRKFHVKFAAHIPAPHIELYYTRRLPRWGSSPRCKAHGGA